MEAINCTICNEIISECTSTTCTNDHYMCKSCFNDQVKSQISPSEIGKFIERKTTIVCSYCNDPFNDQTVLKNVDCETFEQFMKIKQDIAVANAEAQIEKRINAAKKQSKIDSHRTHICENILTMHCGRCNAAVFDFDGCFAIECASCKWSICGWCMSGFADAHHHVMKCSHSLCNGSVHGTFEQFNQVHKKRRKAEVIKYLNTITDINEKNELIEAIEKDLTDIGINIHEQEQVQEQEQQKVPDPREAPHPERAAMNTEREAPYERHILQYDQHIINNYIVNDRIVNDHIVNDYIIYNTNINY